MSGSPVVAIHTPRQSGHAFHSHYINMVDPWRHIEYHPMRWEQQNITDNTVTTLKLVPLIGHLPSVNIQSFESLRLPGEM